MLSFNKVIKKFVHLFSHKKTFRPSLFIGRTPNLKPSFSRPLPQPVPHRVISLTSLESLPQPGPASFPDSFLQSSKTSSSSGVNIFPLSLIPTLVVPAGSSFLADPVAPEIAPRPRCCPEFAAPLAMGKDERMKGVSDSGECQDAGKYAIQVKKMKYRGDRYFPPSPL
ncbi:hypothetical protein BDY24DRAFT_419361 [Mrakia frigida]|uniref:uncharacterized protein n=1 Tax=Mrakia frigida TaxID=29902 RepID=UPI003FCC224D